MGGAQLGDARIEAAADQHQAVTAVQPPPEPGKRLGRLAARVLDLLDHEQHGLRRTRKRGCELVRRGAVEAESQCPRGPARRRPRRIAPTS